MIFNAVRTYDIHILVFKGPTYVLLVLLVNKTATYHHMRHRKGSSEQTFPKLGPIKYVYIHTYVYTTRNTSMYVTFVTTICLSKYYVQ